MSIRSAKVQVRFISVQYNWAISNQQELVFLQSAGKDSQFLRAAYVEDI